VPAAKRPEKPPARGKLHNPAKCAGINFRSSNSNPKTIYGEQTVKLNSFQELYTEQLRDLYDAEQQIIKALPKMIEATTSEDLREALTEHLDVTQEQATRLEKIFTSLGEKAKGEKCKGMQGVIAEGDELIGKVEDPELRDAAIIASAQRVEHYEMAGYGTARTYANLLDDTEASKLLQQTLEEEKEADQTLTELAEEINATAGKSVERSSRAKRRTAA
jgi:ferritin-like metal-binding protein YciE